MQTKIARFTNRVVSLAQKAVAGEPKPAYEPGDSGYADWVIIALHGLREYLYHPYRRLMDVLYEIPRIVGILGLEPSELPDFSTRLHTVSTTQDASLARPAAAVGGAARTR